MKTDRAALALLMMAWAGPALAETLDNAKVIALVQAGLDDQTIVAKIRSSGAQYDTATDSLIALKKAGVPGPVIAAMIETSTGQGVSANAAATADSPDPRMPHPSGIYMLASWLPEPKMLVVLVSGMLSTPVTAAGS